MSNTFFKLFRFSFQPYQLRLNPCEPLPCRRGGIIEIALTLASVIFQKLQKQWLSDEFSIKALFIQLYPKNSHNLSTELFYKACFSSAVNKESCNKAAFFIYSKLDLKVIMVICRTHLVLNHHLHVNHTLVLNQRIEFLPLTFPAPIYEWYVYHQLKGNLHPTMDGI